MRFIFGVGRAKPVPVNFSHLRDRRMGTLRGVRSLTGS